MKLSRAIPLILLMCFPFSVAGAATKKTETVSEGFDTVCEITGYTPYAGSFDGSFLKKGDSVAVIAPCTLPSAKQIDAAVKGLRKWGYVPIEGKHLRDPVRTLEDCLSDLEWALEDPDIKAVFCIRGGYGGTEVMDVLPENLISASGKLIIGYSDVTAFHSAWTVSGLPSIHASMSAAFTTLPEDCAEAEQKIIQGEIPIYRCRSSSFCRKGKAEGILIGGNLSTFAAVLGTAYDSTKLEEPYILFLEDIYEDMAHIHRLLTILKHQGVLDGAEGILFGEWMEMPAVCDSYNGSSRGGTFQSVADMISREFLQDMDVPVVFGFPAGHGPVNYPLLMGEKARLTVTEESYTLSW